MNPLVIGPIFELLKGVLGGLGLDPEAKARAQAQAFEALTSGTFAERTEQAIALAQVDVNKADAAGASPMQRNWRPMVGWVCAAALAWDTVGRPMATYAWVLAGHVAPELPALASEQLYTLLFGLLGLGALRSVEKVKGAAP